MICLIFGKQASRIGVVSPHCRPCGRDAAGCITPDKKPFPMKMHAIPIRAPVIAVATVAAVAAAAAVEDGFPDPSGYTSAASAAATDFDSFVSATGVSSASLNDFHSFVSTVAESEGSLERFNSNPPAGFVLIVR